MASYDGPPRDEDVEVIEMAPNHTGHAAKVFAIHMGILLVICILIGIFWEMNAMWVCGGFGSFFMMGWHINAIDKAIRKDKKYYKDKYD
jgi:hypothetical protein